MESHFQLEVDFLILTDLAMHYIIAVKEFL